MYNIRNIIIICVYLKTVCSDNIKDVDSKYAIEKLDFKCNRTLCVQKCCPMGQYVWKRKACMESNVSFELSEIDIYDSVKEKTGHSFTDIFGIVPGAFNNDEFHMNAYNMKMFGFQPFLEESGTLSLEFANTYQRWIPINRSNYCVDYMISLKTPDQLMSVSFWAVLPQEDPPQSDEYMTYASLVSCVFMLLVLAVYAVLPELRNLCGMILMAYVASLFWAFLLLAVIQIGQHYELVCFILSMAIYFFFLATFCWMNVMSYDIWWTFRGYAKARPIHRRGERFKFLMYCLYAWGVPLLMTIGMGVINKMDLRHLPWFVTPNIPKMGCFLEGGPKFLYLYVPMLIMIVCNWMFYMMTAYNVWRLSRGSAVLANSIASGTASAHRSQRNRFMVYLKLSIVMGLNWLLEVVSFVWPDFKIWYISDVYNVLIGFAIFLIFVCKKKILKKLVKRYHAKKLQWEQSSKSYSSSNSDSSSNPETMTLQISGNPRGF